MNVAIEVPQRFDVVTAVYLRLNFDVLNAVPLK